MKNPEIEIRYSPDPRTDEEARLRGIAKLLVGEFLNSLNLEGLIVEEPNNISPVEELYGNVKDHHHRSTRH